LVWTSQQDGGLRKQCKASAIAGDGDVFRCRSLPWERSHDLIKLLIAYPLGFADAPVIGVTSKFRLELLVLMPCIKLARLPINSVEEPSEAKGKSNHICVQSRSHAADGAAPLHLPISYPNGFDVVW
jgi:hypothetical protein